MPDPQIYVNALINEIRSGQHLFPRQTINTLYFGGGTPSLLAPKLIISILRELANVGFTTGPNTEVTIEINPATLTEVHLQMYLEAGFNRFSVGAQTFDDRLLKMVRREHSSLQTIETLALLRKYNLNFNFDLLFALPTQTLAGVSVDLDRAVQLGASHISAYCLTVPESHPLSKNRAPDEEQAEMFQQISDRLGQLGMAQYEISNYSMPGKESQHNLLYWTDQSYWGLGLSAHSYDQSRGWGARFWNTKTLNDYLHKFGECFKESDLRLEAWPEDQIENLEKHQALTDFCHTSFRLMKGLDLSSCAKKFGTVTGLAERLATLKNSGLIQETSAGFNLTAKGVLLSNQVFQELTFLSNEL